MVIMTSVNFSFSAYKLFVKKNLPPLYIVDNEILYKNLDQLCNYGLLAPAQCIGQLANKKTSLEVIYHE